MFPSQELSPGTGNLCGNAKLFQNVEQCLNEVPGGLVRRKSTGTFGVGLPALKVSDWLSNPSVLFQSVNLLQLCEKSFFSCTLSRAFQVFGKHFVTGARLFWAS